MRTLHWYTRCPAWRRARGPLHRSRVRTAQDKAIDLRDPRPNLDFRPGRRQLLNASASNSHAPPVQRRLSECAHQCPAERSRVRDPKPQLLLQNAAYNQNCARFVEGNKNYEDQVPTLARDFAKIHSNGFVVDRCSRVIRKRAPHLATPGGRWLIPGVRGRNRDNRSRDVRPRPDAPHRIRVAD